MPQDVFVACSLPGPAQVPFAQHFASRFNEHGRTLADAELIAACETAARNQDGTLRTVNTLTPVRRAEHR